MTNRATLLPGSGTAPGNAEPLEHALRSEALGVVACGVAHDVKNPLNAMALQLALLGEKLGDGGGAATHLTALKEQIGRVNEVMRRFLDVADPAGPFAVDVAALVGDALALLGHEARRRRVALSLEPAGGVLRSSAEPGRLGRLVLGVVAAVVAEAPEDGRVVVRVGRDGPDVLVELERTGAAPGAGLAALAAAEPEGLLTTRAVTGGATVVLRLPGEERS